MNEGQFHGELGLDCAHTCALPPLRDGIRHLRGLGSRLTAPEPGKRGQIWRCPPPGLHSNRGLRINFCRMKTKPGALESGTVPHSFAPGFVFIQQKLMRSPPFEWSPGGGHPGGHQTAVGGFKWASWCAASPLGRSTKCRGTGGSRVGV